MEIFSSRMAFNYLSKLLTADTEEFWCVALTASRKVIGSKCLFRGTVDSCPIHPRDVFRYAYIQNASAIIVAHNHPSLDPKPSLADRKSTRQLLAASKLLQLPLLDHIIIGGESYWSFADSKLLGASRTRRLLD